MADAVQSEIAELWKLFKETDARIGIKVTGDDLVHIVNDERFRPRGFGRG